MWPREKTNIEGTTEASRKYLFPSNRNLIQQNKTVTNHHYITTAKTMQDLLSWMSPMVGSDQFFLPQPHLQHGWGPVIPSQPRASCCGEAVFMSGTPEILQQGVNILWQRTSFCLSSFWCLNKSFGTPSFLSYKKQCIITLYAPLPPMQFF